MFQTDQQPHLPAYVSTNHCQLPMGSHEHDIELVHRLELAVRGAAQDGAHRVAACQVDLQSSGEGGARNTYRR